MQGMEASEQETELKSSVGIDVSKHWLDIHVLPCNERLRVCNNCQGIRQLKRWVTRFDPALIVVEATGKWHRDVQRSLAASGIPVALVDPFRVRMFAKADGILAKTDRLDAKVLASFAAIMAPPVRPPAPQALAELAEFMAARMSVVKIQTMLKNERSAATFKLVQRHLERRIERGDKEIAALDAAILERIEADEGLARRYTILTSIPCIGFVTAAVLITCPTELGNMSAKQSAMLAGLAPIADQSGKRDGVRVIFGGRARVRRALYLAALSAVPFNPDMRPFYARLKPVENPPRRPLSPLPASLLCWRTRWSAKIVCGSRKPHLMLDLQHRCSPASCFALAGAYRRAYGAGVAHLTSSRRRYAHPSFP
jgi:transposase